MKKLIIFDCDGTLVDSESIANVVSAQMLTDFGYPITREEEAKKFIGLSDKQVIETIIKEGGPCLSYAQLEEIQNEIMKAYPRMLKPLMLPFLLSEKIKKHDICVASSSPRSRVLLSLEVTGQKRFFQEKHIFTQEKVTNTKPSPDLFLLASKTLGYETQNCLVIEDSVPGIQAAKAAKMDVIAFLGGAHTQPKWYREKIQKEKVPTTHNLEELNDLFDKWGVHIDSESRGHEKKVLEHVKRDAYV